MSQERFWILFSKKLAEEADRVELAELEGLIQQHPEWQYAIQNLADIWQQRVPSNFSQEEDAYLMHLHRMSEKNIHINGETAHLEDIPTRNKKQKWYWMAAACVILAVGFVAFWPNNRVISDNQPLVQVNEISTRMGSRSKVQLPDGSTVWLNAGSKLTYDKDYGRHIREVQLVGEAFFDVMKDKNKPFFIHTSNITIKVLGTTFNVKAYPEDKKSETSLIKGSIEVTIHNRPDNKIILSPNEKLVVENTPEKIGKLEAGIIIQPAVAISKIHHNPIDSSVIETVWVENYLAVQDETLADLAVKMERWYNVQIIIKEPELQEKILTVTFNDETIDQALHALKESIPFRYEKNGTTIFIYR